MKKLALLLFALSIQVSVYSYTWQSFGPDTIDVTNVCFGVGSSVGIICSPDGMYLYDDSNQEWNFYTKAGLPVWEATHLNANKVLVIIGDGSWSDGIYTFDLGTHQFEIVEWFVNPTFLKYHQLSGTWFAGFNNVGTVLCGLYKSTDGLNWDEVSFFNEIPCACMDYFEEHLVISSVSNIYDIYWSDDSGNTWNQSSGTIPLLTDIKFNNQGELYGIFPDLTDSSGLWKSDDFGNTWDVEFWSENMSAVGFDAMGTIFTGWESPYLGNEGIAIYDPDAPPPGLTFLNEGLPNININKILLNPTMSAMAIFCCTDSGVYFSLDYMVGKPENYSQKNEIDIYPNPTGGYININYSLAQKQSGEVKFRVLNCNGQIIDESKAVYNPSVKNKIIKDVSKLSSGIYYCIIENEEISIVKKLIVVK